MDRIYKTLFHYYGAERLKDLESYDNAAVQALLNQLSLDQSTRLTLDNALFDFYHQGAADGFALGLHLGLSLLHDQVRRPGPQQCQ